MRRGNAKGETRLALEAWGYLDWHLARARRIDLVELVPGRHLRARVMVDGQDMGAWMVSTAAKRGFVRADKRKVDEEDRGKGEGKDKDKRGGWCE